MRSSLMILRPEPKADNAFGFSRRELVIGATIAGGSLLVGACSPTKLLTLGTPKTDFGAFGPFIRIDPAGIVNWHGVGGAPQVAQGGSPY
jgi:hypothetical protein